jgi:hypothetical protein
MMQAQQSFEPGKLTVLGKLRLVVNLKCVFFQSAPQPGFNFAGFGSCVADLG